MSTYFVCISGFSRYRAVQTHKRLDSFRQSVPLQDQRRQESGRMSVGSKEVEKRLLELNERLEELQELLYAERKHLEGLDMRYPELEFGPADMRIE